MRMGLFCHLVYMAVQFFLSHKWHDFREKNIIEHKMCVLIISTPFVWNISHSKKMWARYRKCILLFKYCNKTWILWIYFEKYSDTKFHEKRSSGSRVVPCGRTDRHTNSRTYRYDEAYSRVSQCTTNRVISSWMRAQLLNQLFSAACTSLAVSLSQYLVETNTFLNNVS